MPRVLWLLIGALGVQILLDVVSLASGWAEASAAGLVVAMGALAVDVMLLWLLYKGGESTRALLRAAAGVGVAVDGALLLSTLAWAPSGIAGVAALVTALGMLACSGLAFAVLGSAAVTEWTFSRWLHAVR